MPTGFDDLLQQAELLNTGLDGEAELPRVQRNFQQLLTAGDRLCSQIPSSQDNAQIKASLLLSSQGQEVPKISDRLKALSAATDPTGDSFPAKCDTDVEGFLRNERENAILSLLEEDKQCSFQDAEERHWQARMKEWESEKQQIISKLLGGEGMLNFGSEVNDVSANVTSFVTPASVGANPKSLMTSWDLAYARQMHVFNDEIVSGSVSSDLVKLCAATADKMKESTISNMWAMVSCMTEVSAVEEAGGSVYSRRTSPKFLQLLVTQSKKFLEKNYMDYMKSCIYVRPHVAQLGGEPGTLNLVKSFLKVHPTSFSQDFDDGELEGAPLWAVIFYCLRCGDLDAVCSVVRKYEHVIPEFSQWVQEYRVNGKLTATSENKLKVHYKKSVHISSDPYKVAVYSIIGRCDTSDIHCEVVSKTEDYLWLKLSQLVMEEAPSGGQQDVLTLMKLQTLLCDEYGESHFNAANNPLLYFQILFLTCQFEAAVEFLSRSESLRGHATHVAISLHVHGLLLTPRSLHTKMLSTELGDENVLTKIERLNFAQLIMLYTRKFELTDPREALNYFYCLRHMRTEGQSLFRHCTSELVRESGEFEMLLGRLNADGSRQPGAVDKYCARDTNELISKVASDTESKGLYEDAVHLFDLCGQHDKTISLLNKLLCPVISASDESHPDRQRLKNLAVGIAERYRNQAIETSRDVRSTFHLLLDLASFFDLFHADLVEQALDVVRELQILPLSSEQVPSKVSAFKLQSDEVRGNISELLLATLTLLTRQCNQQRSLNKSLITKTSDRVMSSARTYARAIITFAGMLPYHLPGDTTARLVQLEVQMH